MQSRSLPLLGLIIGSLIAFAANSVLARAAIDGEGMDALAFAGIRLTSGAIVLLPVLTKRPSAGAWREADLVGAVSLALYAAGFSLAYVALGTGTGALVLFAAVQMALLTFGFIEERRLRLLDAIGVVLALCGLTVLIGGVDLSAGSAWAIAAMTGAGLAWGVYTVRGRLSRNPIVSTASNFVWATVLFGLPALTWVVLSGQLADITLNGFLFAVISGALASGLGYTIWYRTVPHLDHATAGAVQLATPAVAAIGAALFLSEPIGWTLAAGGVVILSGIGLTLRQR